MMLTAPIRDSAGAAGAPQGFPPSRRRYAALTRATRSRPEALAGAARLAVAFTGLAKCGSFSTRRWLLEALAEAAEPQCTAGPMLDRFAELASAKFAEFSKPSRFLTVFCSGYMYDSEGPRALILGGHPKQIR
jgi:hypothetical protein